MEHTAMHVSGPGDLINPAGTTVTCITVDNTSVTGNLVNAGTIAPGAPTGIVITNNSTVDGAVINSGTISASHNGISVVGGALISGGISNSGTISAATTGIVVGTVTSRAASAIAE
jgi:hypothetical protein